MGYINYMRTVNCGDIMTFNIKDPILNKNTITVEVLYPEKHNPTHQIVCYYFLNENRNKVEITIHRDIRSNTYGSEVYFFKNKEDTQHYRSMNYSDINKTPIKYREILKSLYIVHKELFGGN